MIKNLKKYNQLDAAIAIFISELWPANSASPIKHAYAWRILLAQSAEQKTKTIKSYMCFKHFLEGLYKSWPSFPMLEDFPVQADWGQIKITSKIGNSFSSIFYGSILERTPDLIESFRIAFAGNSEATTDIETVIELQNFIIQFIPELNKKPVENATPAQCEIPPEWFWSKCQALIVALNKQENWQQNFSESLTAIPTSTDKLIGLNEFSNAASMSEELPWLGVLIEDCWVPVAVRSAPNVVIEHWSPHSSKSITAGTHAAINHFLYGRFRQANLGPLVLIVGGRMASSFLVSSILVSNTKLQLIVAAHPTAAEEIVDEINSIVLAINKGAVYQFMNEKGMRFSFGSSDSQQDYPALQFVLLITQTDMNFLSIPIPNKFSVVCLLSDFVTLYDAVNDEKELFAFLQYLEANETSTFTMTGLVDQFAAFKDSNGVLNEGAIEPNLFFLDPHWGNSWRYQQLLKYWQQAPNYLPNSFTSWHLSDHVEGSVRLISRNAPIMVYSAQIGSCTFQAGVFFDDGMEYEPAKAVDLFNQLLIDAAARCQKLLHDVPLFNQEHILINAKPTHQDDELLTHIELSSKALHCINLSVNTNTILAGLSNAQDASFEMRCLVEVITQCSKLLNKELPSGFVGRFTEFSKNKPRYFRQVLDESVDVRHDFQPLVPSEKEYKLARKQLAKVLLQLDIQPGRYELAEAKQKIDQAKQQLNTYIQEQLSKYDKNKLIPFLMQHSDASLIKARLKITRTKISLQHEVDYDRTAVIKEANKVYEVAAKHYRYLIEKVLSESADTGVEKPEGDAIRFLIAMVDWYRVLNDASDVLHNRIGVGGIDIDDNYVPEVFYEEQLNNAGTIYAELYANQRLHGGEDREDELVADAQYWIKNQELNTAFKKDAGFEVRTLLTVLRILSQSHRHGLSELLSILYHAKTNTLIDQLIDVLEDVTREEVINVVSFLKLDPTQIKQVEVRNGEIETAWDVPFWEHKKRLHRYAIRPIISCDGELIWGAESCSGALAIWLNVVQQGFLPASFNWPNASKAVRRIKEELEKQLEKQAATITQRHAPYIAEGIDFYRKFQQENFEDIGDFDVLAYYPEESLLIAMECKYNEPFYTMKDGRRLRDRIFGRNEQDRKHHLYHIEKRREFLKKNAKRMLELLKWPLLKDELKYQELYISRDTYYWMVNPPYKVPTQFVRVSDLDAWLQAL